MLLYSGVKGPVTAEDGLRFQATSRMALRQVFLQVIRLSTVIVIPQMLKLFPSFMIEAIKS